MAKHVVAHVEDLKPGDRKRVLIDGRAVAVFNVAGAFHAISDTCPHRGASLSEGKLTGLVTSSRPGDYQHTRAGEIIRCPWHQWEFDLKTGRSYCDPRRMRAMSFPVTLVPGTALAEGPYKIDAYPVSVDGDYVVVEIA